MFTFKLKFRVQFQRLTSTVVTTEGLLWQGLQEFYLADPIRHLSKLTPHTPGYSGRITSGALFLRDIFTSAFSVLEGLLLLSLYVCVMCMHSCECMRVYMWRPETDTQFPSIALHHILRQDLSLSGRLWDQLIPEPQGQPP